MYPSTPFHVVLIGEDVRGYSFANSSVNNQLAEQQIYFFPSKAAFAQAKPARRSPRA